MFEKMWNLYKTFNKAAYSFCERNDDYDLGSQEKWVRNAFPAFYCLCHPVEAILSLKADQSALWELSLLEEAFSKA